jgi:hypothetical protein
LLEVGWRVRWRPRPCDDGWFVVQAEWAIVRRVVKGGHTGPPLRYMRLFDITGGSLYGSGVVVPLRGWLPTVSGRDEHGQIWTDTMMCCGEVEAGARLQAPTLASTVERE